MNFSITSVFGAGSISFLGVMLALIISFSHISSEHVLNQHVRALIGEKAERVIQIVKQDLDQAQSAAEVTVRRLTNGEIDPENRAAVEYYLFQQLISMPNLTGIYVGWSNGEFLYVKHALERGKGIYRTLSITHREHGIQVDRLWRNDSFKLTEEQTGIALDFDPRQRPWYGAAVAAGHSIWVAPYLFNTSKKPGITVASPALGPAGKPLMVVGVDLDIYVISKLLCEMDLGPDSTAFIVEQDGKVIGSTGIDFGKLPYAGGKAKLPHINDLTEPAVRGILATLGSPLEDFNSDLQEFSAITIGDDAYHAYLARFPMSHRSWIIGIGIPDSPYLSQLIHSRDVYILVALGIALVVGLVMTVIVRTIVQPVRALSHTATRIRTEGFGVSFRVQSRYKELNNLSKTFNDLLDTLQTENRKSLTLAEELKHINLNLEDKVKVRTQDLQRAKDAAERHAKEQENFITVLSHEFKSPLAKISTLAQVIQLMENDLSVETATRIAKIRAQAMTLKGMINKILTSLSIAQKKMPLSRKTVALRSFLLELCDTTLSAEERDRIDLGAVHEDLSFRLNPGLVALALGNILTNALKYSGAESTVVVSARIQDGRLVIEVTDRGRGMSLKDLDIYGIMYGRGDSARNISGIGLGGYIVKKVVHAHCGSLEISSKPDEGTTVIAVFA